MENNKKEKTEIVKELPDNMTGHIVYFKEPLIVEQTKEERKKVMYEGEEVEQIIMTHTGKVAECRYMRVRGGFGAYKVCSGRMLIGEFYKSIEDIKNNKPFESGNTKEYPSGYIPSLFDINLVEKL